MIRKRTFKIYELATTALMTALICIIAPFSIQLPGLVPISMATLVVFFSTYILGWRLGTLSVIIYICLGLVGLPVFSGGMSGPGKLLGPTGGFVISYVFMALIFGIALKIFGNSQVTMTISMLISTLVSYVIGSAWYMIITENGLIAALLSCVVPFIITDILKIVIILISGPPIRKRLVKSNLVR